jgi:hypothetical protein
MRRFKRINLLAATAVRSIVGLVVVVMAVGGGLAVSGALAASGHPNQHQIRTRSRLAVFAQSRATSAKAASAGPGAPAGAVLGLVAGSARLYAWQPTASEESSEMRTADGGSSLCLVEVLAKVESIVCGAKSEIEERGIIGINLPSITAPNLGATALVPNGVTSVEITDSNGKAYSANVVNNLVAVADPDLASVSYTLPDGQTNAASVQEAEAGSATSAPGTTTP